MLAFAANAQKWLENAWDVAVSWVAKHPKTTLVIAGAVLVARRLLGA